MNISEYEKALKTSFLLGGFSEKESVGICKVFRSMVEKLLDGVVPDKEKYIDHIPNCSFSGQVIGWNDCRAEVLKRVSESKK